MKRILSKALIVFLVSSVSIVSFAEEGKDTEQDVLIMLPGLSDKENPIKAVEGAPLLEGDALGVAPPLTQIMIYAVGSSQCGWEYLSIGQWATSCDHGGRQLRVGVLEIGYGVEEFAKINGNTLSKSSRYSHQTVCLVNGYYTWPCQRGTVVGWFNEYSLDGYQGGHFEYENTSRTGRPNKIHVFINIQ